MGAFLGLIDWFVVGSDKADFGFRRQTVATSISSGLARAGQSVFAAPPLHELFEIAEDRAELGKLQSSFLLLVFKLVERANHRNWFENIPLVCLT
jgi:hypothetical protein